QHMPGGCSGLDPVEHTHDAFGEIADAGVRRLGGEWAELPVRDDQEAVLAGLEHQARGLRCSPVARSTAGARWPVSPYTSACTTWRSTTMAPASTGTATTGPTTPSSVPMRRQPAMGRTGGGETRCSMMGGTARLRPVSGTLRA